LYLSLAGEVKTVNQLSGFLQTLFSHERFSNPRLLRQTQVSSGSEVLTTFEMEMEYLPLKEAQP